MTGSLARWEDSWCGDNIEGVMPLTWGGGVRRRRGAPLSNVLKEMAL